MGISYLVDNIDYTQSSFLLSDYSEIDGYLYYGPNDLSKVQRDIASHLTKQYIPLDVEDKRFSFSLSKIQGCAAFSIKAIFTRPTDSFLSKWVGGLCIFILPVGHLIDFGINSATVLIHTALVMDAIAVGVLKTGVSLLLPKNFKGKEDDRWFDFRHTRWFGAAQECCKSLVFGFAEFFLLPLYYLRVLNPLLLFKHSYWVYDLDSGKFHLVLDQEKVKWLQNKYGYTKDCETLLKLCIPSNPALSYWEHPGVPCNLKLSYDASGFRKPEDIKITATWIGWRYAYTIGNVHYYDRINNSYKTHWYHKKNQDI